MQDLYTQKIGSLNTSFHFHFRNDSLPPLSSLDSTPALDLQAIQRHINLLNRKVAVLEQENRNREWDVYYLVAAYVGLKCFQFLWNKLSWRFESTQFINKSFGCILMDSVTSSSTRWTELGCFVLECIGLYNVIRRVGCFLQNRQVAKYTQLRKMLYFITNPVIRSTYWVYILIRNFFIRLFYVQKKRKKLSESCFF